MSKQHNTKSMLSTLASSHSISTVSDLLRVYMPNSGICRNCSISITICGKVTWYQISVAICRSGRIECHVQNSVHQGLECHLSGVLMYTMKFQVQCHDYNGTIPRELEQANSIHVALLLQPSPIENYINKICSNQTILSKTYMTYTHKCRCLFITIFAIFV